MSNLDTLGYRRDADPVTISADLVHDLDAVLSSAIAHLMNVQALVGLGEAGATLLDDAEAARDVLRMALAPARYTGPSYAGHPGQPHRMDCCK